MASLRLIKLLLATGPVALLAACGGSGGGEIASASNPPATAPSSAPAPTPTPAPAPTEVLKPEVIALQSDTPFVTLGVTETNLMSPSYDADLVIGKDTPNITASTPGSKSEAVDFRFDPTTGDYAITFPDGMGGKLGLKYLNGSAGQIAVSTGHTVSGPNGDTGVLLTMPVPFREEYPYTYSHLGGWTKTVPNPDGSAVQTWGLFVYGHETPSSQVPRTGSATYRGEIIANSPIDPWEVLGSVQLNFDFGGGTLAGSMHPIFDTNGWYPGLDYDYGSYDFAQTIYSTGSSRFSGAFARNGTLLPDSWFDGSLTGPGAEEFIGRFVAPFERDGLAGSLTGIWIGKKD